MSRVLNLSLRLNGLLCALNRYCRSLLILYRSDRRLLCRCRRVPYRRTIRFSDTLYTLIL